MKLNIVPARAGLAWFNLGVRAFQQKPLALVGLVFLFFTAPSLLSMVPVLGKLLAFGMLPAATLGLMVATEEATKGNVPTPMVMLSAFRACRQQLRALLLLGLLYALGCFVLLGLSATVDGGKVARFYLLGEGITLETLYAADFQAAILVVMALLVPLSMLFWHAPALVHWHGVTPIKSLFFSLVACWRNFRAFLVYGLVWLAAVMAVNLMLSILDALINNPEIIMAVLVPPLLLMFLAVMFTSAYFSFRDCFDANGDTP